MKSVKVLHLSTWSDGGAAIAATRLSESLTQRGMQSSVVHAPNHILSYIDAIIGKLTISKNTIFHSYNYFGINIKSYINSYKPDIVHIHWIGAGFVRPESLTDIKIPIVWTLHDLWPLCGAEHLPGSMRRFTEGYLSSNRPVNEKGIDLDRYVWSRKVKAWKNLKITYVAPSTYVRQLAHNSRMLNGNMPIYIPNGLNIKLYSPNISSLDRINILFCAPNLVADTNKGFDLYIAAMEKLPNEIKEKAVALIVGTTKPAFDPLEKIGIKSRYFGVVKNDKQMARIYNSATLTVVSSRMETLSFVTMESLACGTPVVAFRVGGITDLIKHNVNGYLAEPYRVDDLAKGICQLISDKKTIRRLARKRIVDNFNISHVAQKYESLYQDLVKGYNGRNYRK